MKKRKKQFVLFLSFAVICSSVLLSGCENKPVDTTLSTTNSETSESAAPQTEHTNKNDTSEVASAMTAAVVAKDYKTILSLMGLDGEDSFVTEDDIAFQLPRSNYSDLLEVDDASKITTKVVDKTKTSIYAKVYQDSGNGEPTSLADITLNLNDKNEWVVSSEDFVNENFTFRGPSGNVTVTVNGKDLANNTTVTKKTKTGSTAFCTDYTLPKVGVKSIKVNLKSENYDFTKELDTESNNEIVDGTNSAVFYDPYDDEKEAITAYIKNTWNALYNDWESGKKATEATQYISAKADVDILKTVWNGFDTLTKPSAGSSKGNDNYKMEKVLLNSEANTSYLTDSIILVNFKYELHWHYKLADWNQQMRRFSNILLEKAKDGYKIYSLGDTKLFTEANSFTKEWD